MSDKPPAQRAGIDPQTSSRLFRALLAMVIEDSDRGAKARVALLSVARGVDELLRMLVSGADSARDV